MFMRFINRAEEAIICILLITTTLLVFLDVVIDPTENVYPMIPAGGSNHEMLLADPPDLKKPKSTNKAAVQADSDTVLTA